MNLLTKNPISLLILSFLCIFTLSAIASDKQEIDQILAMKEAPDGVVFELIGRENSKYLPDGLKKIEAYKIKLEEKFPDIEIAVVTHGAEQFELTKANAVKQVKTHDIVKRITAEDIPVHICATHASWRDIENEDFPDYVTVSDQGPSQIRDYQEFGYLLVVIK